MRDHREGWPQRGYAKDESRLPRRLGEYGLKVGRCTHHRLRYYGELLKSLMATGESLT